MPIHVTEADKLEAAAFGSLSKRSPGAMNGTGLGPIACIARNNKAPRIKVIPIALRLSDSVPVFLLFTSVRKAKKLVKWSKIIKQLKRRPKHLF